MSQAQEIQSPLESIKAVAIEFVIAFVVAIALTYVLMQVSGGLRSTFWPETMITMSILLLYIEFKLTSEYFASNEQLSLPARMALYSRDGIFLGLMSFAYHGYYQPEKGFVSFVVLLIFGTILGLSIKRPSISISAINKSILSRYDLRSSALQSKSWRVIYFLAPLVSIAFVVFYCFRHGNGFYATLMFAAVFAWNTNELYTEKSESFEKINGWIWMLPFGFAMFTMISFLM